MILDGSVQKENLPPSERSFFFQSMQFRFGLGGILDSHGE